MRFLLINQDDKIVGAGSEDSMHSEARILNRLRGFLDEFDDYALGNEDRFLNGYIVVPDTLSIRMSYAS